MNITVIFNPTAGGGRDRRLRHFVRALEQGGARVRLYHTRAPGDATRYLNGLADQGECVVAAGGDGTTNDVINGLKPGVALALFPIGTANVLARELNLPRKPEAAAAVVLEGRTLMITPARLNGRRFLVVAGVGYDAWVVDQVDLIAKRRIGKLAYALSMLRQVLRYGEVRFRVTVDGRPLDCFSAVISNGRYYGGSFILSRQANLNRRSVQVLLFQRPGRLFLLRCLTALLFGRMERVDGVTSLSAERVTITAPGLEPVQTDGDPAGFLPAEIELEPEPVAVRVPWA
ncbi:diacylglycerol/lipid kinase family protein [Alloalcanivorax gelatiniphagus]|uniref:Diacylglycerol kinase family lipid kinase n=1 Tax=Alloalcanivorax gelatiniphagus TaxID=1194167 RepID=A0ABY2XH60_9GAMM|nr:diacylglycerol kinase family protein [Alloalcanivorax gelatiniphagus]TMW10551.1 diacylglycerol kinase family lipid kinase [Alloalcanivorax gelatiniphagus]|tara:strand:+ start:1335 stop:2198 length:864 start_codon:yes stop_codon:yes gene_type:complete